MVCIGVLSSYIPERICTALLTDVRDETLQHAACPQSTPRAAPELPQSSPRATPKAAKASPKAAPAEGELPQSSPNAQGQAAPGEFGPACGEQTHALARTAAAKPGPAWPWALGELWGSALTVHCLLWGSFGVVGKLLGEPDFFGTAFSRPTAQGVPRTDCKAPSGFRDWVDSTQSLRTIQIVPRRGLPVQARYQGLGGIHPVRDP